MDLGVDEAGKGPVLGSMFAACVRADPTVLPDDLKDSKQLSPSRREQLAEQIRTRADGVAVVEIPVERIDDPQTDMNSLTVQAHAGAVNELAEEGLSGYVDAGDTNAVRFERRVEDQIDVEIDLLAEHGADESYPVVSAASIIAKESRERHVAALRDEYGELGSGYPSDETTRAFLRSYLQTERELPACARRSWQTSQDLLAARDQASLSEF